MTNKVAIIRDRFVTHSELDNYCGVDNYDLTVIGSKGHKFESDLNYRTIVSASSAPKKLRRSTQAITSLISGSSTYMCGLVDALSHYDIIHTVETFHGFSDQAIKAKDRYDNAVVCTVWENIPYFAESTHYSRTWRERLKHWKAPEIKRRVRENVDLFLPVTEQAAESLRIEGVSDERIEVVPIGVDPERFSPGRIDQTDRSPQEFGLGGDDVVNVVFVGRYTYSKGIYDLLSAWKTVVRCTDQPVHLTLIGGGDNREQVAEYASYIDVPNVSIRGSVPYDDVPLVFDAADLAILPSLPVKHWQEQYGRVILEAQATGTAVAASETGGIPNAMGGVGELFQPGEPKDIAETILGLVVDKERREILGKKGRERILRERTLQDTVQHIEKVYNSVI